MNCTSWRYTFIGEMSTSGELSQIDLNQLKLNQKNFFLNTKSIKKKNKQEGEIEANRCLPFSHHPTCLACLNGLALLVLVCWNSNAGSG